MKHSLRFARRFAQLLVLMGVWLLVMWLAPVASGQSASQEAPIKHEVKTDKGNVAHILLSVERDKKFHEQQAKQEAAGMSGGTGACPAPCNLVYNTGPVMRNPTNYLIFWQPPGRAAFPAGYQAAMEQFMQNLGGTPFYNIVTQYNDNTGVVVPNSASLGAPSWTDTTTAAPSGCNGSIGEIGATPNCPLTDGDVQNEVTVALGANPTWAAPSINVEYFVFTPSDTYQCMDNNTPKADCWAINGTIPADQQGSFCAYHSNFNTNTIYAYHPFASNGNCFLSTQTLINNYQQSQNIFQNFPNSKTLDVEFSPLSHEMIESNTDPQLSAWRDAAGSEIGDKCAYLYAYAAPDGTNIVLNGNRVQIQQEWSNDVSGCAKRYGASPVAPVPGPLSFGEVQAGATAQQGAQIQNNGLGDLNILNMRLAGTSPTDYSLLNTQPTAATLHASENLTANVQFAPPSGAVYANPTDTLIVDTDQTTFSYPSTAGNQLTASITGTIGVPPQALCAPAVVSTDLNLCSTANASINNGSYDPDGEAVSVVQSPAGPYSLGKTAVTLTVTDNNADHGTATCSSTVTVQDHQAPTITCPAPQSLKCTSPSGAAASIVPTVFDNCPAVTYSCVPTSGSTFGFGTTPVTCTATDASGNQSMCGTSVTVTDVPPVIASVVASPALLSPPNKKLVPVNILVKDTDTCDPSPVCAITNVTANQAIPASYIKITGPLTVNLANAGNGGHPLTYIVTVTCTDAHGGNTSAQTSVTSE